MHARFYFRKTCVVFLEWQTRLEKTGRAAETKTRTKGTRAYVGLGPDGWDCAPDCAWSDSRAGIRWVVSRGKSSPWAQFS